MKVAPCMNCQERYQNCHSECEKYLSMREKIDKRNKIIQENKYKEFDIRRFVEESKIKTIKRKK